MCDFHWPYNEQSRPLNSYSTFLKFGFLINGWADFSDVLIIDVVNEWEKNMISFYAMVFWFSNSIFHLLLILWASCSFNMNQVIIYHHRKWFFSRYWMAFLQSIITLNINRILLMRCSNLFNYCNLKCIASKSYEVLNVILENWGIKKSFFSPALQYYPPIDRQLWFTSIKKIHGIFMYGFNVVLT